MSLPPKLGVTGPDPIGGGTILVGGGFGAAFFFAAFLFLTVFFTAFFSVFFVFAFFVFFAFFAFFRFFAMIDLPIGSTYPAETPAAAPRRRRTL